MRDMTAHHAANRAQAEFLSQVTHELKAPLNTIVTYVEELAEDGGLTLEERKEYFNTLNAEATRMAKLISNLLQMSRIQMGNLSASLSLVKPVSLIREQTESLVLQAEDRGLTLDVNISENLPPVHGDKDLLGVAVNNLISNAIKYTPSGGKISVRALAVDGGVRLEVKDTGVGIPAEIQSRIFERFFRSDQEHIQDQPGSGLGLSLVREIVEIHKGRIFVESEIGRGSKFVVWLPCRKVSSRLEPAEALT
jgi:signal transduction histidine kinase